MSKRRAQLHGRVVAAGDDAFVVFDAGEVHTVASTVDVVVGDLVVVDGPTTTVVHRGNGEWPPDPSAPARDLGRLAERVAMLGRRAALLAETRQWFTGRGFIEVETPLLVPSPGTEVHLDPMTAGDGWLITSPEYAMKRLLAAGAGPIYQLGKVFRAGERGRRHRPEFTMLEWYRPWVDGYEVLMDDCESLLGALAGRTLQWQGRRFDLTPPWPRLTFFELLRQHGVAHPEDLDEDRWLGALVDFDQSLGSQRPLFVTEWPAPLASLSRRKASDPRVAERFELYLGGLELGNAFAELTDAPEQRARCEEDNRTRRALQRPELPLDEDFLAALEAGMPPSAGIAVGFDRVAMLCLDAATIDEVVAF